MRIRPLTLAAVGVLFAAVDLRLTQGDALPDAVGWALIGFAAHRLGMRTPAWLAAIASVASLAELHLPYQWQSYDVLSGRIIEHPGPGTAYDQRLIFLDVDGARLGLMVLGVGLGGAALTMVLLELRRRAATTTDEESTERLGILAWAVLLGWTLPYVLIAIGWKINEGAFDPVWNGPWELVALVGIGVAALVALLFATTSNRRWSASDDEIGSPWADLMVPDPDLPSS
ncbi:MAG: hypothetical protein ACJ739_04745 [Acidimicrobiales bacterium]